MWRQGMRDGYGDEDWIMAVLHRDHNRKDYFEVLYQLLAELQGSPSFSVFVGRYVTFDVWQYNCREADEFIAKLERSGNEVLCERGKYLRASKQADAPKPQAVG